MFPKKNYPVFSIFIYIFVAVHIISTLLLTDQLKEQEINKLDELQRRYYTLRTYTAPSTTYTDEHCMICFDEYNEDKQEIYFTPCGHSACMLCYLQTLMYHNTCPQCRTPI